MPDLDAPTHKESWKALLRQIGLGQGLHEPLREQVIEDGYRELSSRLKKHDAEVWEEGKRAALTTGQVMRWGTGEPKNPYLQEEDTDA